jgi:hypothetical protein
MKELFNNNYKCINLPVKFTGPFVDFSKDFIKELNLEYGSTYSFMISYGVPLTFKGVPYNPLTLTINNAEEGPVKIKSSIFYSYQLSDARNKCSTSCGSRGKVVKYEDILHTCI